MAQQGSKFVETNILRYLARMLIEKTEDLEVIDIFMIKSNCDRETVVSKKRPGIQKKWFVTSR